MRGRTCPRDQLAEQRATGGRGTWDQDPPLFTHLLLQRWIEKYQTARRLGGPFIFDRGIPDCIVYAVRARVDPRPSLEAAEDYRYHPHVLLLEPWEEIYATDEERVMTFEDTVSFSRSLKEVYERAGYVLDIVQPGSIMDRVAFVRSAVEQHLSIDLTGADLATLIAMADTDEVVRLRLLRAIRDLGV